MWSNSSRCRQESVYLLRTWCLYTWSCLYNVIIIHFSINCLTVICSPTIILMLLREATSETYGPRVYLLSYLLPIYFYLHLYFLHLYYKIPKIYLSYHTISIRSHFRKWPWRDWQPLYCVGCEFFVCLCRFVGLVEKPPTRLIFWFSKIEGNTYATIAASPSPLRGKPMQAQDVARRISGAVAREVFAQIKTYQVPITNSSPSHLHYLPFASHFPLPHFTLAVLFALSFPISLFPLFSLAFFHLLVC